MLRSALLSSALCSALLTTAQLPAYSTASAYAHHTDVNAQWMQHSTLRDQYAQATRYANDTERIAAHLTAVHAYLSDHTPSYIDAEAQARRAALLDSLNGYASRGKFPQNHVLPYRNPIFIDPAGTPCAVGYLMIASGHLALAERIDMEMETAYLNEIQLPEVDAWAGTHGFTREELAWIQPGYLPAVHWAGVGNGTNGNVNVLLQLRDGRMLVAGDFTEAGGAPHSGVALWNGTSFSALGDGVNGTVFCALEEGGRIHLGGNFGQGELATWNGNNWSYSTPLDGQGSQVDALHIHGNTLYAAGSSQGFAGLMYYVRMRTGNSWTDVATQLNGPVHALASHNGKLVIGGAFTGQNGPTDPVLGHVAVLEEDSWTALGAGLDAAVHSLLDVNDTLYAGGVLYAHEEARFGLARFVEEECELLIPNMEQYFAAVPDSVFTNAIHALHMTPAGLIVGGNFASASMMELAQGLSLRSADGRFVAQGFFDGNVRAIHVFNGDMIIGGAFSHVNFAEIANLASSSLPTAVGQLPSIGSVRTWPNPATDRLRIDLSAPAHYSLLDASGRTVSNGRNSMMDADLDVSALTPGLYTLLLHTNNGERYTARFLKQ